MIEPATVADDYRLDLSQEMELYGWQLDPDEFWFRCTPPAYPFRPQGWKIHVSTALASAGDVLAEASQVLFAHDTAFKFARSSDQLKMLLSHRYDRGGGSKFITAYPRHDSDFRRLVQELHEVTKAFEGPAILSDQRLSPGSSVFYRYGAMSGSVRVHRDQGYFDIPLMDPAGEWQEDNRNAYFSQPGWSPAAPVDHETWPEPSALESVPEAVPAVEVSDPPMVVTPAVEGVETVQPGDPEPSAVNEALLLNGRYEVLEAIRHSNRGGVYRALDHHSGQLVVVKEARAFIGPEDDGTDMTDRLRHEFRVLTDLQQTCEFLPEPVEMFEQEGHQFLVETQVPGQNLRDWAKGIDLDNKITPTERETVKRGVIKHLTEAVSHLHGLGYLLRDLSPGNVMVDDLGGVRLIDPEFFLTKGGEASPAFTYGYVSPLAVGRSGPTVFDSFRDDEYGLAMCIIHACTRAEPLIVLPATPDRVVARSVRSWLQLVRERFPLVEEHAPQLEGYLEGFISRASLGARSTSATDQRTAAANDLGDGLALLSEVDWSKSHQPGFSPWPVDSQGVSMGDTASVQTGVTGIVQLLVDTVGTPATTTAAERALERGAHWLCDGLNPKMDRNLPGLYFGRAGTAWTLCDAGRVLGEPKLIHRAREILRHTPVRWTNPDVTHGLAGSGLAHLHYLRSHHDDLLERRLRLMADAVLDLSDEDAIGLSWHAGGSAEGPAGQPSTESHLGFAHGVAGIGTFLLEAARYFENDRYYEATHKCFATLAHYAIRGEGQVVDWPVFISKEVAQSQLVRWWCSGSGGIGTFLVRYALQTGDEQAATLATGATNACLDEDLRLMPGHCHGISGNGHLLLDHAEYLGTVDLSGGLDQTARMLRLRRIVHDDRMVIANDSGNRVSYSFGQGLAGSLSYLLRYLHATPRPYYPGRNDFAV